MIIQKFLTPNRYSRPQTPLKLIKKVVVHYVGNAGSSALGNWNYFEDLKNGRTQIIKGNTVYKFASSHYIIDLNGDIYYSVPENEIAYTSNSANVYSIGIECCHPTSNGKFSDATYNALTDLVADICLRYNLNPLNDVLRHYDITKKPCPLWFVNHLDDWDIFKQKINNKLLTLKGSDIVVDKSFVVKKIVTTPTLNIREKPDATSKDIGDFYQHDVVTVTGQVGKWYRCIFNNQDAYIHSDYVKDYTDTDVDALKINIQNLTKENTELRNKINKAIDNLKLTM